uniref:ubiquitinyl hydrolase 1 n=1 Tax=Astyanax mexicanus TaxID=7994 RepID=A0A8B9GXN3_ASTMX
MQKAPKKYFVNMDEYLASVGLYRKMMARDASCLFRAVSEQLYYSQNYHCKIRKDCVDFMRTNRSHFEPFVEGFFEKYLERCFIVYRYPGKPPSEIGDEDLPKILLCCSSNGHYDIVYSRTYPVDAAICQSLLYELLYTCVLGIEEEDLHMAVDGFRAGGRRYRNSLSMCSEDGGYETPEDRGSREEWEFSGHSRSEDKAKFGTEDQKAPEAPMKLSLPYKVLKALEPEMYRNVEFDVWQDSRKGTLVTVWFSIHAVTVFIEELGEKHLVSLTNLKPVNPVPAWNVTPSRKGSSYSSAEHYPGDLGDFYLQYSPAHNPSFYFKGEIHLSRLCLSIVVTYIRTHSCERSEESIKNLNQSFPVFLSLQGQTVSSTMVPGAATYWVPGGSSNISSSKQPITSSEEDPDERSTAGDHGNAGFQAPSVYAAAEASTNLTIQEGGSRAGSPQEGVATYSYSQQVVVKSAVLSSSQPVNSAPAAIFTSNSSPSSSAGSSHSPPNPLQPSSITPGQPPPVHASPWFVNEVGEPVTVAPPPPYSYDPNGSDLPRDCKVLQYFFNLGVQTYQQSYWHSVVHMQQVYQQPAGGAEPQYQPYPNPAPAPSPDHTVPQPYPEPARPCLHPQGEPTSNGTPLAVEPPTAAVPGTVFFPLVQEQCSQPPLHPTYEPYLPVLSTTYHYLTPWTPGPLPPPPLHHTSYCPSSLPHVNYVTAPSHPTHFVPPGV